jgi:hypothetical protein
MFTQESLMHVLALEMVFPDSARTGMNTGGGRRRSYGQQRTPVLKLDENGLKYTRDPKTSEDLPSY